MKRMTHLILIAFLASLLLVPLQGKAQQIDYVPGEVVIKLKDNQTAKNPNGKGFTGQSASALNSLNNKFNVQSAEKAIKQLDQSKDKVGLSRIYKLKLGDGKDIWQAVNDYKKDSAVEWAEPNYKVKAALVPNDTYYATYQWNLPKISAPQAWDITTGSSSLTIAITDTGVDYNHPDLGAGFGPSYKVTGGYDFVNSDTDPMDDNGHGTHCSGIASAVTNNSTGVAGVSWDSKIMAVKVLDASGSGTDTDCASGIDYAASHGANIISMSWGGYGDSQAISDAITNAHTAGCILVAAAGNDNTETAFYPAAYNNVIAVASTDNSDHKSYFSNYGTWVDVCAPGGDGGTPDIGDILSTLPSNSYGYGYGTSMACPHVSGLAALVKAKYNSLTNDQIVSKIISSAYNIDSINPSYAGKLGNGRINAFKAVSVLTHPNGTLVQVKSPYSPTDPAIYRIEGGQKRHIPDPYVFNSQFSWSKVVAISTIERDSYADGTVLPFRDGELVKEQSDAKIYVFADSQKHWITTLPVFSGLGYKGSNVLTVSNGELAQFAAGADINTVTSTHPNGALVQVKSPFDPKIYLIQSGQKRWIPDTYVFNSQFSAKKIIKISATERGSYTIGTVLPFRDGELVKDQGTGAIYVFEGGQKRHIVNPITFNAYGYSASNVLTVTAGELNQFPTGSDLTT